LSPNGRRRLRLLLRDLGATAAFTSIVLSGSVPVWALVMYAVALVSSLSGRRPLAHRPVISVVLLLLTALVLFGLVPLGRLDLIIAACTFAGLVTSHRMLSAPTPGTDQQVHLTSLLTLSGGAALTGQLWFGACLAIFTLCASLSLGLSVLEPPEGSADTVEVRPALSYIALGTAFAVAGGIAFFVFFPRLSWNLAARRTPPGLGAGVSGMSDTVQLGGTGDIKSSPRIIARVRLGPDPGSDRLDAYWPGRSFESFDGREWKGKGSERPPKNLVTLVRKVRNTLTQQIELLPAYGSRTLIAMDRPVSYFDAVGFTASGPSRMGLVEVEGEETHFATAANAYKYTAASLPPEKLAPVEALDEPARYLQLPGTIDPRVKQLADRVLDGEQRPRQAAATLQRFLQREYGYTLELSGAASDPLTDFLFTRKAGHCEHFATALTVLLRTQGIAARVTAGFYGGERLGDRYVLRAGDAHAWTQVFVPGKGWETFDATPEAGRGSRPQAFLAWLIDRYEQLEAWWDARVIDYSFQTQVDFVRSLVRPPDGSRERVALPTLPGAWESLAAFAAAVVVYVLVQRLARRLGRRRPHPASGFLDQIEVRLSSAHIAQLPGESIEELAARLSEAVHPIAPAVASATRAYLDARFGGLRIDPARRKALLEAIRAGQQAT
jgi:transglutaminase-like putative cysteine protease